MLTIAMVLALGAAQAQDIYVSRGDFIVAEHEHIFDLGMEMMIDKNDCGAQAMFDKDVIFVLLPGIECYLVKYIEDSVWPEKVLMRFKDADETFYTVIGEMDLKKDDSKARR